ncbi:hypothetical protein [Chroococcidiopsis sp.]|uniref:hypothetical protein n=1 Tax=Chroococcidiopsis sp. TaxID=3088168 RepID=UPI003F2A346C
MYEEALLFHHPTTGRSRLRKQKKGFVGAGLKADFLPQPRILGYTRPYRSQKS